MTLIYSVILCLFFKGRSCQPCVQELTTRPYIQLFPMTEGQSAELTCMADILCEEALTLHWEWTKADGRSTVLRGDPLRRRGDSRPYEEDSLKLTPSADDHNTNITCVANYDHSIVKTTVSLTVEFLPKIQNGSQCMVEGKLVVCVCISRGNPLPLIYWPWASLTNFSVTRYSSIQTVHSTMLAADYTNTKCISSNKLGRAEFELPLQNYTENYWLGMNPKFDAALPWIIAGVSLSLNLVLLTTMIILTYKRGKNQQRKPSVEINTYASLNQADFGQEYSVISPHPRAVSKE
ncbi:sialic acid-binding Ig-like lectin 5 [Anarrhichthys ocellatus]|uniref:sialic acid-binding Ig-like lectin 5 n=1 Tax=Anarrhichthys ocellatus TaxID=433405 RepID=UPI0012EEAACA|nr:sialic acid-binding Ig-like lectin 5 [Anarrhichthys ocellatus]